MIEVRSSCLIASTRFKVPRKYLGTLILRARPLDILDGDRPALRHSELGYARIQSKILAGWRPHSPAASSDSQDE